MSAKKIAIATLVAAAVGGGAVWLGARAPDDKVRDASDVPRGSSATSGAAASAATPAAKPHVARLADPVARATLIDTIRQARERRTAVAAASSTVPGATPPGLPADDVDKQYIRDAVHEIIPLLADCYNDGLARDPTLAGSVVVDFTIEGETGVGGIVSESTVDTKKTDLGDPAVTECIQETMYALTIDPPSNGGIVHVTYPFAFAPGE